MTRLTGAALAIALLIATPFTVQAQDKNKAGPEDSPVVRLHHYNLQEGAIALSGYDPVSYFKGSPQKGKKSIRVRLNGVNYLFVNEENKKAFEADPEKYEPAYGGWCAWAMLDGTKYKVDPENYKIIDGHNYLFYKGWTGDTLKKWNEKAQEEDENGLVKTADQHWVETLKE